ncbi:cytochrome P450 704C1-like isoform X1 [Mangifera indica]|uniref:cytochrome P450 704C1-like isoform X1 n=2 Tax=Mangifera indica TaxID=29780 RepID=UPI001CFBF0E1|nr:cytochrome P450 704C1-like isoform X1 [Mangifera indica]
MEVNHSFYHLHQSIGLALITMMNLKELFFISIPLTAATLTLILGICIHRFYAKISGAEKRKRYHPVGCTVFHLAFNFHRLHDAMADLALKHTTFRLISFFRSDVYTAHPPNIEYILKTNFGNYGKGSYNYDILTDLLGDGIFTVDGEKWRRQRKIASYEFSTKILRDFSSVVFKATAVKLAGIVSRAAESNQSIEIQELLMKSTLDSVFKILLGIDLDCMCGTFEEGAGFSDAFDKASAIVVYRYVDIFWKIKRFLNIGSEAVLRKSIKVIDEFVYKLIRSKIEQLNNSHADFRPVKKEDIVSRFLDLKETDPKYLRDIVLSFVTAGKDTTASTLSWFLYMLCKHPHIQERIAKEVIQATQMTDDSSTEELAAGITEETIEKMHYLHAVLTETLRLYPAAAVDGKICFSDDTLPDGFSVKKGDLVAYLPYAMGRMKSLWGDDAEEFQPERWLNENGHFQAASPFIFTTFQARETGIEAGPRVCLGKEFAYRQMKIFSMILLGSYKFKLSDEKKRVNYRSAMTLQIEGGLHLCASPRLSSGK